MLYAINAPSQEAANIFSMEIECLVFSQGTGFQQTLLDFLDKEQQQQSKGGEVGVAGSEARTSGDTKKKNKRKRLITEFCCEDDSDFDTLERKQKLKMSPSCRQLQATVNSESAGDSLSYCSTRPTSVKEGMGQPFKKSKSAELASYLLSRKASSDASSLTTEQPSTATLVCHTPPRSSTGGDGVASSATSSTVEYDFREENSHSGSEGGSGEWMFEDCDLTSFSNFDDDDT